MMPFGLLAKAEDESMPSLTEEQKQLLAQQTIDETTPGTILKDFQAVLDFISPKGIEVSGVNNLFPLKHLRTINELLSHPIELGLKRPVQKSYPYIHGLYWLLRASGMTTLKNQGKKQILVIDKTVLASWQGLNPTERYFTLLEAWMVFGSEEIIAETRGLMFNSLYHCLQFFKDFPVEGKSFAKSNDSENLKYWPGLHNLALLDLFGLISVTSAKVKQGKGWQVGLVKLTPFGMTVLELLRIAFFQNQFFTEAQESLEVEFGQLQPEFQEFFPEWQQNLVIPTKTGFKDGLYIFKVSLGKMWRRIAIPGKLELVYLADAILESVEFDSDHLYKFTYKNRFCRTIEINHPYVERPPYVDEVRVGDLSLESGDRMTYVFDFGDWWEFNVQLEDIKPADKNIKNPKIIETHGKSPEQYPDWDEWDEDDEDNE